MNHDRRRAASAGVGPLGHGTEGATAVFDIVSGDRIAARKGDISGVMRATTASEKTGDRDNDKKNMQCSEQKTPPGQFATFGNQNDIGPKSSCLSDLL